MQRSQQPARQDVLDQLARILRSEDFERSARSSEFISYIVNKTLDGQEHLLKGYTIGVEVFGKPEDFDPDSDAAVRVEASRLRKALTLYYHQAGKSDSIVITIPKGGYRPFFSYCLPQVQSVDGTEHKKLKAVRNGTIILCILVSLIVTDFFLNHRSREASGANPVHATLHVPVVAVLPFYAIGDANTKQFSENFTSQIIRNLTYFNSLKALSSNTVSNYKKWKGSSLKIGKELKADFILEGTIQKKLPDIRVTIRMLDARRSTYVWSFDESYSLEEYENKVWRKELLGNIASQLASPYGIIQNIEQDRAGARVGNAIGYQCKLSYYAYCSNKTAKSHKAVRICLEATVENNPKDSDAWAYLSWIYGDELRYDFNMIKDKAHSKERALNAARKALNADDKNAYAHQYMANAASLNGDQVLRKHHLEMALELNPINSEILADAAWQYGQIGNWKKAKELGLKAINGNPGHPRWYRGILFSYYYQVGDYDNALLHALEYYQPDDMFSHIALAVSYAGLQRDDEAEQVALEIEKKFPNFVADPNKTLRVWAFQDDYIEKLIIGAEAAGVKFAYLRK